MIKGDFTEMAKESSKYVKDGQRQKANQYQEII